MLMAAKALEAVGLEVVRFDFPYREHRMPALKDSIARVAEPFRQRKLLIGGRSMGGRAASMLAADGFRCDGLLLLAYPLHPAGKPERLRDAHLPAIHVPVLCFNGTKDALCTRELMEKAIAGLPAWRMHWLAGAGHSFRGRDMGEVAEITRDWLSHLG
jgi:predicted alpha/beta-hydrolase family hydrolase